MAHAFGSTLAAASGSLLSFPGPHDVTRHILYNGLTVLVRENHTSPTAIVHGYLKAGSMYEIDELAGLARLTASTVRRGTANRTFQEINETIESVGASLDIGASSQLTGFSGKSLSEDLPLLIEITADMLQHPVFPEAELQKARGQTITWLHQLEDNTQHKADRVFRSLCYPPGHPYARSTEGTLDSIQRIRRADLVAHYERFYRPRTAAIVIVGDVQTEKIIPQLEAALGSWQAAGDDADDGAPDIPAAPRPCGVRRSVAPMYNKTQVDIVWGLPGLARLDPDYYTARVANAILGQVGLMGRLGANVRDRQGLAYYASSDLEAGLGAGPWLVFAGVAPDAVDRAIDSILIEIVRLRDELVAEEELADAQDYLTGVLPLRLETNDGVAGALIEIELYGLGLDYLAQFPQRIRAVTRERVQAVAQTYLDPENYALAIAGPYGEPPQA
ncbi:MAG: M16 family metallopeptidase [Chloroflexota bacterium]